MVPCTLFLLLVTALVPSQAGAGEFGVESEAASARRREGADQRQHWESYLLAVATLPPLLGSPCQVSFSNSCPES